MCPSRPHQRGAAALFGAIGMIAVLAAAAFAIDLGQLYLAKRELQNMANLAALDVARAAGGCLAPELDRQATANERAVATITQLGGDPAWLAGGQVGLGRVSVDANGLRQFESSADDELGEAFAFSLRVQRPLPSLLIPLPGLSAEGAVFSARADSAMAPNASFAVGSFAAAVGPGEIGLLNDLFSNLLGAPLALDVASYQGLVESSIELDELTDALGLSTVVETLTEPQDLPGVLTALANALFDAGNATAGAAAQLIATAAPNQDVVIGDVVVVPEGTGETVGQLSVNALQIVRGLVFEAAAPVLELTPGASIPGVVDVLVTAILGENAQIGAGPPLRDATRYLTTARNTQGDIGLDLGLLPLLGSVVRANLRIEAADATAELREIRCAGRGRSEHEVILGVDTSLARLVIDNPVDNPLIDATVGLGGLLSGFDLGVKVCWQGSIGLSDPNTEIIPFEGPFGPDWVADNTERVGSELGASLTSALSDLLVTNPPSVCAVELPLVGPLLEALLASVVDGVTSTVLASVVSVLNTQLIDLIDADVAPLLELIGVSVGGADVVVQDVYMVPPALIRTE